MKTMRLIISISFLIVAFLGGGKPGYAQTNTGNEDKLILTESNNFLLCNDAGTAFKTRINNGTVDPMFRDGTFEIDLGDGTAPITNLSKADFPKTIQYNVEGTYSLKFSATTHEGVKVTRVYQIKALGRPKIKLQKQDEKVKCLGSEVVYLVEVYNSNSSGTRYTIDYDDGSPSAEMTNGELAAAGGKFMHKYTRSYCDLMHAGSSSEAFVVKLNVVNECNYIEQATVQEFVAEPINAKFTFQDRDDQKGCTYENLKLRNISTGGRGSTCAYTDIFWEWDFGNGRTSEEAEPEIMYSEAKNYRIRLIGSNIYPCASDTAYQDVVLIKRAVADFAISKAELCAGEKLKFINKSSGDELRPFYWSVVSLDGNPAPSFSGNDHSAIHPEITFDHWGKFQVSLMVTNGCSTSVKDTVITVRQNPDITRFELPAKICPLQLRLADYVHVEWNGNEEKPKWEITRNGGGAVGYAYAEGTGEGSTYPVLDFTAPGDYTFTLTLPDAGCPGTTLTKTGVVHVYDREIIMDFTTAPVVTGSEIQLCDKGILTINNNSRGEDISMNFALRRIAGSYTTSVTEIPPFSRKIAFEGYGDCQVLITMTGHCSSRDTVFNVHITKDPSFEYFFLPAAICPDEELAMTDYVRYSWNGNTPKARWTFEPATVEFRNGTTAESLCPVVHFLESKTYKVTVALDPSSCPDAAVAKTKTQEVRVRESALTSNVRATKDSICEGDMVMFNNEAADPEGRLDYVWTVTPAGGWKEPDLTHTEPTYRVVFEKWGTYYVTGVVKSYCDEKISQPMKVVVHKNAEVVLRDTVMCPGIIDLKYFVDYKWYNNKQQATWFISRTDGADQPGDYSFVNGTGASSFYPVLRLNRTGDYKVNVTLGDAVCDRDQDRLMAEKVYHVYDTTIYGSVALASSPDVPDPSDICEGEIITFANTLDEEGGMTFRWTVEGEESGYDFVAGGKTSTEKIPQIRFTKYGNYKVQVVASGKCNRKTWNFPVVVRGVPEIQLQSRMNKICTGSGIEMNAYLQYIDNKNNPLTYLWTVTADRGVANAPVIDNPAGDFTRIVFSDSAHYTITLQVGSKCVLDGVQRFTSAVDVISSNVKARFSVGKDSVGCVGDADPFEIRLSGQSTGDSLSYAWNVVPENLSGGGWTYTEGGATSLSPKIRITEQGYYNISLHISNICGTGDSLFRVKSYDVPDVVAEDIRDQCEPFHFKGRDQIVITENNDPVRRVQWTITPNPGYASEGYNFVNSTSSASAFPDINFSTCDYEVKAEYWNRCQTPGVKVFQVRVDKFVPIDPALADKTVCVQTDPFELTALPEGGTWTLKDPSLPGGDRILYKDGAGKYHFSPVFDAYYEGDIELVYSRANLTCMARDTMNVHVNPLPRVEAGDPLEMCINHAPLPLLNGAPVGGNWVSATADVTGGSFHPVSDGTFKLNYVYSDANGCRNQDSTQMTVHPLPVTVFSAGESKHCIGTEVVMTPQQLGGNKFEWNFGDGSAPQISQDAAGHSYTQAGFVGISNVTTSPHGCVDESDTVKIEIINLPPKAFFDVDTLNGCAPLNVNITINPDTYKDNHNYLSFKWDYGEGTTSEIMNPESPKYYSPGPMDTTYLTRFTVSNMCGTTSWDTLITAYSSPKVSFALMHKWECTPVYLELQNTTSGNNCRFNWTFRNGRTGEVVETTDKRNPSHEFTTDSAATVYYITLWAQNQCNEDTFTDSLIVKPRTISAHFSPSKREVCTGEEICFRNNSTDTLSFIESTYWNFGDGGRDSLWNPCHIYREQGKYTVSLFIDNGCGYHSVVDTVRVNAQPHLEIRSEDMLCETDTFTFVLRSDQELKINTWNFGDNMTDVLDSVRHVYAGYGDFVVTAEGITLKSCRSVVTKNIRVHNKPIISILPLDTAHCTPLFYKPEVTGEGFFMWDFGDGTALNSSGEHFYENRTDTVQKFPVIAYVKTDKGCKSEHKGLVSVYNAPRAIIGKEVTKGKPEKVVFTNLSEKADDCIWELPQKNPFHSLGEQEIWFDQNGDYLIRLIAFNSLGCTDSVEMEHHVEMKGLYFPNSFIPHSKNPKVSRFNGIGIGLVEYRLEIYDTYGNKVWETTAIEQGCPSEGWDGCNVKGELLPQGVYVWRARAIFRSDEVWTGKNNDSGVSQTVQGTVLMLRE